MLKIFIISKPQNTFDGQNLIKKKQKNNNKQIKKQQQQMFVF